MASINSSWESAEAKDALLYPYILAITFTQLTVSSIGLLLNGALVFVTLRNKSLHHSLGLLLAISSFCDAMVETSIFPTAVLVLQRKRISLFSCCFFQLHSTGSASNSYLMLFFISLDRLFSLAFPIIYKKHFKLGAGKYVLLLNCLSLAYICYGHYLAITNALNHPEILVYCEPGDIYTGEAATLSYRVMLVVTMAAVFNYILMGCMLRVYGREQQQANDSQREITRHLFKSLAIIMAIIFLSYPLYGLSKGILVGIIEDPVWRYLLTRNQMVPVAQAINAPVLFICSEYRNIAKKEFKCLDFLSRKYFTSQIVEMPATTMVFPTTHHQSQPKMQ